MALKEENRDRWLTSLREIKIKWEQRHSIIIFVEPPGEVAGLSMNAKNE